MLKLGGNLTNSVAILNSVGNLPEMDDKLFVMGFGLVDDSTYADTLQGLTYDFLQFCQNRFDDYNPTVHLCADANRDQSACDGDGGSPAVLSGEGSVATQTVVGLASFSDGPCGDKTFDVYTRVSTYSDWVTGQICKLSSNPPFDPCFSGIGCFFFAPLLTTFRKWSSSVATFFGY